MSDNEIIKALECCKDGGNRCNECPYGIDDCLTDSDESILLRDALDLIKRQKAEIEILTGERNCLAKMEHDNLYEQTQKIKKAKSEAIKEFAERLKKTMISTRCNKNDYRHYVTEDCEIDNLVKEMVGDADA